MLQYSAETWRVASSSNQSKNHHLAFLASYLTQVMHPLQFDKDSQTNFLAYPAVRKKISDIYFLRSVSLSDYYSYSAIYFSILFVFFFKFPSRLFDCSFIYQFVHCIVCCLCVYHVLCYLVLWPQD